MSDSRNEPREPAPLTSSLDGLHYDRENRPFHRILILLTTFFLISFIWFTGLIIIIPVRHLTVPLVNDRREGMKEPTKGENERTERHTEVTCKRSVFLLLSHFVSLSLPTPYGHLLSLVTSVPSVPYGVYGVGRRDEPR